MMMASVKFRRYRCFGAAADCVWWKGGILLAVQGSDDVLVQGVSTESHLLWQPYEEMAS